MTGERIPGRVDLDVRAVRAVVRAATAEAFRVPMSEVRARVDEAGTGYDVQVQTRIAATDEPLLQATHARRGVLLDRATAITGVAMPTLDVRVDGIVAAARLR